MTDEVNRDPLDTFSKIFIPILIAVATTIVSSTQYCSTQSAKRFERDSGYLKMLVSTNEKEKDLGLKMVDVVTKKGEFSTELISGNDAVR